jgi:DNA modification methylase
MNDTVLIGDALSLLKSVPGDLAQCCVTSPPYWGLRDYGVAGQLGREKTPEEYVANIVAVFREVRRVLTSTGTLWLNLGDSYTSGGRSSRATDRKNPVREDSYRAPTPGGLKAKDLIGIPWMVAFALRADGWYLRSDIIWHKPNVMPESVTDRPTKSHEYLFLLSKSERYYYDSEAVREEAVGKTVHDLTGQVYSPPGQTPSCGNRKALHGPTYSRHRSSVPGGQDLRSVIDGKRNRRSVWTVPTAPFKGAHFATFPPALIEPCILAGSKIGDTVLDPFTGSGTTCALSKKLGRHYLGIELNANYAQLFNKRISEVNSGVSTG